MSPMGTPLVACESGTLTKIGPAGLGGNRLWVKGDSGTEYYYAHLSAFAEGSVEGKRVNAGDVVGFVGNTGNAAGGPSHLHFEVHPGRRQRGEPVPAAEGGVRRKADGQGRGRPGRARRGATPAGGPGHHPARRRRRPGSGRSGAAPPPRRLSRPRHVPGRRERLVPRSGHRESGPHARLSVVDVTASVRTEAAPEALFAVVGDLSRYPEWLSIVPRAVAVEAADDDPGPAWSVDLRGRDRTAATLEAAPNGPDGPRRPDRRSIRATRARRPVPQPVGPRRPGRSRPRTGAT